MIFFLTPLEIATPPRTRLAMTILVGDSFDLEERQVSQWQTIRRGDRPVAPTTGVCLLCGHARE